MQQLVMLSPGQSPLEFRVGLRSLPYLADHGFQDMAVLPGAFYVDMALHADRLISKSVSRVVRKASFQNPVILSSEDTQLRIEVLERDDGCAEYTFYELAGNGAAPGSARRFAAKLEVHRAEPGASQTSAVPFSIEGFQAKADAVIDGAQLYDGLRKSGNQYGPAFQRIASIWRAGDQSLGKLTAAGQAPDRLHPSLLDAATQLLAPALSATGRTFVLRSIDSIEVTSMDFPDIVWGHATLTADASGTAREMRGDVRVFDSEGKQYLHLTGIAFALLDAPEANQGPATSLVVASNFTAEPLEDALEFWGEHFGAALSVEFAPYNQVFQQLLDPGSAFRANTNGANVVVLGLEEWAAGDPQKLTRPEKGKLERCLGTRPRYTLPNGLEVAHLNQYETEYLYKEIFEDRCYLRHGIRLQDGDTVVDIGANVGVFSLFVMTQCANPKIYAYEPAPIAHDLLKANCDAYGGAGVHALRLGVSNRKKTAKFTFYEKSSVYSGFHSDEVEDREAIQAVVRNMLRGQQIDADSIEQYVDELTADRLNGQTYDCELTSVADIIRDNGLDRIDLLKIDAEKSELDIIRGIGDDDWPLIRQIVIEIHDRTQEAVRQTEKLLVEKGFHCVIDQESLLDRAGFYNLYATRDRAAAEAYAMQARDGGDAKIEQAVSTVKRNVDDFCTALRTFMSTASAPLILCVAPRSPGVELNDESRAAFARIEQALLAAAGALANVHCIGSEWLREHYPVRDYYDPHGHQTAHIPYTSECYAAIGSALIRKLFNAKRSPYKVVALDCDNTLWSGVCGEDGPLGVEITAGHRALQEFLVANMKAGMLLCLCSKNSEQDVFEVFDRREDMVLKREHLVSWKINWRSKSENIRTLAGELNLGLDSIIFVDDNPVECADVKSNCPGVLTLRVPTDSDSLGRFLASVWAFDQSSATKEDSDRTQMYRESAERERYREQTLSLQDFVKGLELRVEFAHCSEADIARVSQLSFRTNQFNFTTKRRSESELRDFLKRDGARCITVRVADRFGDYGLVGVVMCQVEGERLEVDTFLLSCRVLGRGVEHQILSYLGNEAAAKGKADVVLTYLPTPKNRPALDFVTSIGEEFRAGASSTWVFPAAYLAALRYEPVEHATAAGDGSSADAAVMKLPRARAGFGAADPSDCMQRIGDSLFDAERIARAIDERRARRHTGPASAEVVAGTSLEAALADIWRRVLGRPQIGLNDNFFEVGGTSLRAVQIIANIKKELNRNVSIVSLFECPTIAALAGKLGGTGETTSLATAAAAARGAQRRYGTMRRKTT